MEKWSGRDSKTNQKRTSRRRNLMATYPVVNTKTGEQKEVVMSIMEWDKWKDDNPDWTRDYSDPSTVPACRRSWGVER